MALSGTNGYHFYDYNPSLAWNVLFAVLMGLSLIVHAAQMVYYKAWWFGSMFVVGTICELIGYIARCLSHDDVTSMSKFIAQATCLVFAPVFLMAGTYYLLSQLICIYGRRYSWISARLCSWIFIVCDVISLLLQGGGGGLMANHNGASYNTGRGLIITGLVFQLLTMVAFMIMFVSFLWKIHYLRDQSGLLFASRYYEVRQQPQFRYYPLIIITSSLLIFVRSVFRLAEFIQPRNGQLQGREVYFLTLDALMVTLAIALLNVFHPGRLMGVVHMKHEKKNLDESELEDVDITHSEKW